MAERKPINPWLIFVVICIPIFIGSVDLTSIVVVLPQATLDLLGPKGLNKADQALWAVTAYLLAYTLSLALVGRLSDVLPRKQIFLVCFAIFIVGSLWAGLATDLPLSILKLLPIWPDPDVLPLISLVIGRVVQAIGAGASVSVGMALVSDIFPQDQRAEPISLIGALDSLGWVVGNLYAGLMLQILPSWRWIFLINAGIALVAFLIALVMLRGVRSPGRAGSYDLRGALVFAATLITLTFSIEAFKYPGIGAYLLVGASLAFLVLFCWLQLRTRNGLFDLHFIWQPEVRAALITNLIVGFGLILMVAGVPLIINLRTLFLRGEGLLTGALRAGVVLCALTVPLIVAVLIGEGRYRRVGAAIPVSIGLILAIVGFAGASRWTYTAPSYVIALPLALVGLGLGLTVGPLSLVVVDAAEASARGLASSLVLMMRLLGMTFGTPLAAGLTLTLANQWASERVVNMGALHDIARAMLIPPMATDALAQVMVGGMVVCAIGLVIFYAPRVRRALSSGISWRSAFSGSVALTLVVVVVGLASLYDSVATPTIVHNPIAQQLPPNVTFYAAVNIQQLFLENTQRPLNAVINALNTLAPAPTPASTESPVDNIIRALFRTQAWTSASYRQFCPDDRPADQWPDCFNAGLLSWVGPQAAFALLPRTSADQDYLFAFQATNRNNAILFATNLAAALDEKEPVEVGPNIRMLTINGGTANERRLAITQAYVLIGTPKAVQYTLNHGTLSLSDQADYQMISSELPSADFATFYLRSSNFDTDLRPALNGVFNSPAANYILQTIARISPLAFTRTTTAPTSMGMAVRVDERQLMMDLVANVPFSLQKLNASPVPENFLALVPQNSRLWAAANLNISGLARELNIPDALDLLGHNNSDLRSMLSNSLVQGLVVSFASSIQNILTHSKGQMLAFMLPGPVSDMVYVLPLTDKETVTAASTVAAFKAQIQLMSGLGGLVSVENQPSKNGDIIAIHGKALDAVLPYGIQYTLTGDNLLIFTTSGKLVSFVDSLSSESSRTALREIADTLPGKPDSFFYAYVDPAQNLGLTASMDAQIERQAFYLDIVLQAR